MFPREYINDSYLKIEKKIKFEYNDMYYVMFWNFYNNWDYRKKKMTKHKG